MTENYKIVKIKDAGGLPPGWDEFAANLFQKKRFLIHAEKFNSCLQRYYFLETDRRCLACACIYTLTIDLFTFSGIPSPFKMQVIGIPASVSAPGIFGQNQQVVRALLRHILQVEKGLILGLNLDEGLAPEVIVEMAMLPTVVMDLFFENEAEYLASLRAPYRRRALQITSKFERIKRERTSCSEFSNDHFRLYLDIMKRTASKLEILSLAFFQNLPDEFFLTTYYEGSEMLCWHICAHEKGNLFFFFGGHDYRKLDKFQSYFNNLYGIVKEGIELKLDRIDFGQTAEIPKMKAGGSLVARRLFLFHRWAFLLWLIKIFKPFIEYKNEIPPIHPFKNTHLKPQLT